MNLRNKINIIISIFSFRLNFRVQSININNKKIEKAFLVIYKIVIIAGFLLQIY